MLSKGIFRHLSQRSGLFHYFVCPVCPTKEVGFALWTLCLIFFSVSVIHSLLPSFRWYVVTAHSHSEIVDVGGWLVVTFRGG